MPYKSKKKSLAYAKRWRKSHPRYMRDYYQAEVKLAPGAASPLLGRGPNVEISHDRERK